MFTEAQTTKSPGVLTWNTDGYYHFGENNWRDIEIETIVTYKEGAMGLVPKFWSPYAFVYFLVSQSSSTDAEEFFESSKAELCVFLNGDIIQLDSKKIEPLIKDKDYRLKAIVTRHNYQVYLDDICYFNVEYGGSRNGSAAVLLSTGNQCKSIEAKGNMPNAWETNLSSVVGATASVSESVDGNRHLHLKNPVVGKTLTASQVVAVSAGNYSLSYNYLGKMKLTVSNGETNEEYLQIEELPLNDDWQRLEHTVVVPVDCNALKVEFAVETDNEGRINDVQVEPGAIPTTYISNDSVIESKKRKASRLTFPAKNVMNSEEGTISMWIKPSATYSAELNESFVLFQYGGLNSGVVVYGQEGKLYARHGLTQVVYDLDVLPLQKNEWYNIVMTWNLESVSLYVNEEGKSIASNGLYQNQEKILSIGGAEDEAGTTFNGIIDDLIVYKEKITGLDINELHESKEQPVKDNGSMTLRATFNYALSSFNQTYLEIPNAPSYGSPVIVEKEDGQTLRKVSFFDYKTGEYKTWNEEIVIYDGDDYVQVSFSELDTDNFKVSVTDKKGSYIGEPYSVLGKRVYMTLTDDEKEEYKGMPVHVRYQLEDSFTVDYNIEAADSFRVDIAKHDGQEMEIVYEGNRFSNEKLADMVELNPLMNPNHQGFLYVTNTVNPVVDFKVKITPADLPADGISEALVIIEPVDINGNPVCQARLSVQATEGIIFPSFDAGAIRLHDIAGRYIYRYRAPYLTVSQRSTNRIPAKIRIRDVETEIGVEKEITLALEDQYGVVQSSSDFMTTRNSEDLVAAYVMETIRKYYRLRTTGSGSKRIPEGLEFLDFNGDTHIDLAEAEWVAEKIGTTDLWDVQQKILQWKAINEN